ncbi:MULTISPECIES: protein translocase subunit SecF [Carboxydothermus]|uniref:Protein-export membrane protein SecF n=2 Tax=Carboxydothermus TaxID=129957 RepID=Q3ABZ1_CARHZ|nr:MULTISPECIES: protein translocase subunit SecF [Carboxydothermus]ABB14760.1 protein-export membrane protein SecF [Carboxydothermus hydrogenoformans Z-2901]NYE58282.1 preprotein translocase subunit SecF [Carboxydothermus ferrireducens DSM 11255]
MFHIIKNRKYWYIISLLIIVPGIISLFIQGLNWGIDFTGGTILEVKFSKNVVSQDIRNVITQMGFKVSSIQLTGEGNYLIRTEELDTVKRDAVIKALEDKLGKVEVLREDRIGSVVSRELLQKAFLALLIASVLMLLYITFRFEFYFGVAAIIALLHDVFVTIGLFSIFQWEVDSSFVAAILTIIGYSINDTIVIFDRIRENLKKREKGEALDDLINKSLWQTMARSINTVLTVIFVLVSLLLFGGSSIKVFVTAMLIGVTSGAYSSIFNASPIWFDLKRLSSKRKN